MGGWRHHSHPAKRPNGVAMTLSEVGSLAGGRSRAALVAYVDAYVSGFGASDVMRFTPGVRGYPRQDAVVDSAYGPAFWQLCDVALMQSAHVR